MRFYHCSPSYGASPRQEEGGDGSQSAAAPPARAACLFSVGLWEGELYMLFWFRFCAAALIVFLRIMNGKRWRLSVQLPPFKDGAALSGTPAKRQTGDADQPTRMARRQRAEEIQKVKHKFPRPTPSLINIHKRRKAFHFRPFPAYEIK